MILRQYDSASASDTASKTYVLSSSGTNDTKSRTSRIRLDEVPSTSSSIGDEPAVHSDTHKYKSKTQSRLHGLLPVFLSSYISDTLDYLKLLFLPTGYPHSVTPDYTPYQIYDSIQAFASTIASLLSSRAVLQSLNVISTSTAAPGDSKDMSSSSLSSTSTEAATAATLLSILQSTLSNITTILFASRAAPRISPDVKFYRFLADVVNDAAFVLDLLAPSLPSSFGDLLPLSWSIYSGWMVPLSLSVPLPLVITPRVVALCTSSMLRATCGVAGGSSKAVLSAHFARSNPEQVGDLNAKDGSQETIINLMGMWIGGVVVSRVESVSATWCWMLALLGVHLWANYRAVRSVRLRGLNRERAGIVISELVRMDKGWLDRIHTEVVGRREGILGLGGIVRGLLGWTAGQEWRDWRVGVSVEDFVRVVCSSPDGAVMTNKPGSLTATSGAEVVSELLEEFEKEEYVIWIDITLGQISIVLKRGGSPITQLKACLHASIAQRQLQGSSNVKHNDVIASLSRNRFVVNERWEELCRQFEHAGWDLDSINLEDGLGTRVEIES